MNHLLVYLLESSFCLAIFYLFYMAVLRNQPGHQYNRFFLLATSLLSFVLPLLEIPLMAGGGISQVAGNYQNYILLDPAVLSAEGPGAAASGEAEWQWSYTLLLLYASGVLISLGVLIRQIFQLLAVVRQSRIVTKSNYQLVLTEGKMPSSSFFSYLFWDNTQELADKEAEQILAHEEAHIREGHSYDVFYMALLKVVFWFHPLVYLYERALTDVHEFTADAKAIKQQHPGSYARLLTRSLFAGFQPSLVNHFYKSRTLKRIKMMHLTQKQTPRYKYFLALPLLAAVFFTFSCEPDSEMEKLDQLQVQYDEADADEKMLLPDANEVFTIVENMPVPDGGMKEFYSYVAQNLMYPQEARQAGIEGKVFIQFVVNEYGELTEFKSLKGIGHSCDEEAIRVLQGAEAWNPGMTDGKPVKVRMVMPITFKLDDGKAYPAPEGLSSKPESESDIVPLKEVVAVGYAE